jgi:hypothetical protein
MAARKSKPAAPLKESGPKREPVSFDIADAVESGRWKLREPLQRDELTDDDEQVSPKDRLSSRI